MKKLLILLGLCLIGHISFAQNTDYYDRMDHVFGAIDKTKVSTGLLKEFGIRFNSVEAYHGTISDTNWVDKTQWQSLYNSLYTMRIGTSTSMSDPEAVFGHLRDEQENHPNTVLLASQHYTYQQYKANALSNGDVTVTNDRIYDVSGRNPYETKTVFGVAPMKSELRGNSFSFKLQSNMIYGNTGQSPTSISVDFGNGQGYQNITVGTAKNVTYNSGGEKELKFRFTYSGSSDPAVKRQDNGPEAENPDNQVVQD